uniref:Endoribonuclease n=1 Tax=Rhabditophanes sp. KR3021 TaxID=114890 RepID=A0AC35TG02_9BILA
MLFGPSVIIALFAVATALPIDHDAMTQSDVNNALDSMISGDANGAAPGDIVLDYQNEASHSHFDHDNAKDPFFKSISPALLAKPTYVAFNALTATYTTPSIDAADPNTPARNTAIDAWFAAIKTTVPFQSMWTYLKTQKIASSDYPTFVTALKALWFTPYGTGDAGFKEVFSGAVKGTNVVGFANWVQFYQLEQTKALNYHGWFNRDKVCFDYDIFSSFKFTNKYYFMI